MYEIFVNSKDELELANFLSSMEHPNILAFKYKSMNPKKMSNIFITEFCEVIENLCFI